MERKEATKAVRTAKTITNVLSVILLVGGVLAFMGGFMIDSYGVRWDIVISGAYLIGAGIGAIITKGVLSALEAITYASEIYIAKENKYDFANNTPSEAIRAEDIKIQELIYLGKIEEAKECFNKLQFHFDKHKESYEKLGRLDFSYSMRYEIEIMKEISYKINGLNQESKETTKAE